MSVQSHRRLIAATLATLCLPLSVSTAMAMPPDQQPVGDTPSEHVGVSRSSQSQPTPAVRQPLGDTPSGHVGVSRGAQSQTSPPVEIVRPTHTIVRDGNSELPIILAGLALLIALAAGAQMLVQRRALHARVH